MDPVPISADRFANKAMDTLGRHIRRARQNKQLTVRGLARHIGVAASFVADIEADRRRPSSGVLARSPKCSTCRLRCYRTLIRACRPR